MDANAITILLAEDDLNLGTVVFDYLQEVGYKVYWERNGIDALNKALKVEPQLMIIDMMMPGMNGAELIKNYRVSHSETPIIILTALDDIDNKKLGFASGADDYLCKPFDFDELELRLKALVKRSSQKAKPKTSTNTLALGTLSFDTASRKLLSGEAVLAKLTEREANILSVLFEHCEEVVERTTILLSVWGDDSYYNGRTLDVYLSKIRKYLKADPKISISNIHGKGYCLSISK